MFFARLQICVFLSLTLLSCTSEDESASKAYGQASQAFGVGDFVTAEKLASEAVKDRDSVPDYWSLLGRIEMALHNYGAATSAYSRVLELQPNDVESLRLLGQISLLSNRLDDVDSFAQRLLKASPNDIIAHVLQGYAAFRRKDYTLAFTEAAHILETDPLNDDGLVLKAKVDFQQGRRDAAVFSLERSLDVSGASPVKVGQLIDFYRELRDPAKLVSACGRLLTLPSSLDSGAIECADHLLELGNENGALNVLSQTMSRHALSAKDRAIVQLLLAKVTGGSLREDQLTGLGNAAHPQDRAMLAEVALARGFTSLAIRLVGDQSRTPASPATSDLIATFAFAQLTAGHSELAQDEAARVLAVDPQNSLALLVRASIALTRRNFQEVLADARAVIAARPQMELPRLLVARAFVGLGKPELAKLTLREAMTALPYSAPILREYLLVVQRAEGPAAAKTTLKQLPEAIVTKLHGQQMLASM